jgi:uncharacterized DUF497 family protein
MQFQWDRAKARINFLKHHVRFEDAIHVFLDPGRIETYDGDSGVRRIAG